MTNFFTPPLELLLGTRLNARVPEADQQRQREEVVEILRRLRKHPGQILADEVGMGKTFVALAIAYSVCIRCPRGPVIVMAPANLIDKWVQDFKTFCELYLDDRHPIQRNAATPKQLKDPRSVRYGVARHSVEVMKLLDDPPRERCHLIFLAQGAMGRRQTDKWIRLALIAEALRRHGRGGASRLIQVKRQIHRFLAELLWAIGEERAHDWGVELWQQLLRTDPGTWKDTYNKAVRDERRRLRDDPVPKSVTRALHRIELKSLADALRQMPIRARGGDERVSERLDAVRSALRQIEDELWKDLLVRARWRSPLLVMDEAHHLKNPGTALARQLQSPDLDHDLRTGDGAMANAFDRMLFLTATPFQLGHHELVRVLERFGDVRWEDKELGDREIFRKALKDLEDRLNESQRTSITLQRCWTRLRPEDCGSDSAMWWQAQVSAHRESLTSHQRSVVDAYLAAKRCREEAEKALRPWIVRHNKGTHWSGSGIHRRKRNEGGSIAGAGASTGLPVGAQELLPFYLAARSAVNPGKDLLGEALCSSYEAFRFTRLNRDRGADELDDMPSTPTDLSHADWYLVEFDRALKQASGGTHPKVRATVQKVVDLWESGEKVLVFAFYRLTCRALRIHISQEIERRLLVTAHRRLSQAGQPTAPEETEKLIGRIQERYFDDAKSPGRRALDTALFQILQRQTTAFDGPGFSAEQCDVLTDVMRRFLRVSSALVRFFPIAQLDSMSPYDAVRLTLDHTDGSGTSWRHKFEGFLGFLTRYCSAEERRLYLEAAQRTQTGGIRVGGEAAEDADSEDSQVTLANVQVATGVTRRDTRVRLMRAFNTPFFPDILVCSEVMGEGVDLQRYCRHVIHHDLAWNPSTIEQRTGRIDRLGCMAEGRQPIMVYLPYLAGTADERQYRVMTDREKWFRVVMGQDQVARLITPDSSSTIPLPDTISEALSFELSIGLSMK